MKYKVGDKVMVRKDLQYKEYSGTLATREMAALAGLEATIQKITCNGKRYKIDKDVWDHAWTDEMLEPCASTKADLMTGDVVEMANGKRFLTLLNTANGDVFSNHREYNSFKNVNEDLTNGITKQCDIVKVFRATNNYQTKFDRWDEMPLIWECEKPIVEITLEEIAKLKGVEVSQIRIKDGEL